MNSKEKDCIEYALHAYDIFWDYYKKTLDERNQIINNYMIFVGIPIAVLGIIVEKKVININYYAVWLTLILSIIFVLGLIIYNCYIVESFVSERYLKQITNITEYLIENYDIYFNDVFKKSYDLRGLFLNKSQSQNHRLGKSAIIFVINTGIISLYFLMCLKNFKWYYILLVIIISFMIHFIIFKYHKRKL